MSYIYKRGKNYTYSVEAGRDAQGKRRKVTKGGFRTKKEAQQAAAKIEIKIATGTFIFESGISAADFADEWYKEHAKKIKISSSHNELYQKNIFRDYFGEKPMKDISRRDFQEFIDDICSRISTKGKPYSRATLSSIMKLAKKVFRSAMEQELIAKNPTEFVQLPREKEKIGEDAALPKYLEKNQLQQLLDYTKQNTPVFPHMYPIIMTLAYTGCRISEATALQWDDVDFSEKTIRINKDIFFTNELRREYVFQTPKTKKSNRTLKVSKILIETLQEYRRWQNEDKMRYRNQYQENNFVFTGEMQEPRKALRRPTSLTHGSRTLCTVHPKRLA